MNLAVMTIHWWCLECGEDWTGDQSDFACPVCYCENTVGDVLEGASDGRINRDEAGSA